MIRPSTSSASRGPPAACGVIPFPSFCVNRDQPTQSICLALRRRSEGRCRVESTLPAGRSPGRRVERVRPRRCTLRSLNVAAAIPCSLPLCGRCPPPPTIAATAAAASSAAPSGSVLGAHPPGTVRLLPLKTMTLTQKHACCLFSTTGSPGAALHRPCRPLSSSSFVAVVAAVGRRNAPFFFSRKPHDPCQNTVRTLSELCQKKVGFHHEKGSQTVVFVSRPGPAWPSQKVSGLSQKPLHHPRRHRGRRWSRAPSKSVLDQVRLFGLCGAQRWPRQMYGLGSMAADGCVGWVVWWQRGVAAWCAGCDGDDVADGWPRGTQQWHRRGLPSSAPATRTAAWRPTTC